MKIKCNVEGRNGVYLNGVSFYVNEGTIDSIKRINSDGDCNNVLCRNCILFSGRHNSHVTNAGMNLCQIGGGTYGYIDRRKIAHDILTKYNLWISMLEHMEEWEK